MYLKGDLELLILLAALLPKCWDFRQLIGKSSFVVLGFMHARLGLCDLHHILCPGGPSCTASSHSSIQNPPC